jgi:ribosomal protein S6--L-glutamate ligase
LGVSPAKPGVYPLLIKESGLYDKDIAVLTLSRDAKVIPTPRAHRELKPADRLLCFGQLEVMRELIPAKVRHKRRPKVKDLPELPVADEVSKEPCKINVTSTEKDDKDSM